MTGAYMITARTPNRSVTVRRNPYWLSTNAKIFGVDTAKLDNVDGIDFAIGQSTDAEYLQLKNNEIDFVMSGNEELNPPQLQEIATTPDLKSRFFVNPDSSIRWYWFNAHLAAVRQHEAAAGGQLRDRPPGAAEAHRRHDRR